VADRIAFWKKLNQRLARFSNRIDADTQRKILGAVDARIAMPTIEEIRVLQLENAEADERVWSTLQDMHESTAADRMALRALVESAITASPAAATMARKSAAVAKACIDRLKKGHRRRQQL
jgi:hypothetical protein